MVEMRLVERGALDVATVFLLGRAVSVASGLTEEARVFRMAGADAGAADALDGGFRDLVFGAPAGASSSSSVSKDERDFFLGGRSASSSASWTSSNAFLERVDVFPLDAGCIDVALRVRDTGLTSSSSSSSTSTGAFLLRLDVDVAGSTDARDRDERLGGIKVLGYSIRVRQWWVGMGVMSVGDKLRPEPVATTRRVCRARDMRVLVTASNGGLKDIVAELDCTLQEGSME